jgi:PAS domain S-box-containing protein
MKPPAKEQASERERPERRLDLLTRLEERLLRPGTLKDKARSITTGLVEIFKADFARIWLIKPGDLCDHGCLHAELTEGPHVCRRRERCLHLVASSGRYTHIDGETHRRVPFGCYKIGRVAASEEHGFLTNHVTEDSRVHNHAWARELGLVSFAGYKLHLENEDPVGVLALFSQHAISPEEKVLLETVAGISSQVIMTARAEEALERKEQYYRSLLHSMHEDIIVIGRDYRITDINNTWLVSSGASRADVIGRRCYEVSHRLSGPCIEHGVECKLAEVFATGEPRSCRHEHYHTGRGLVQIDILMSPLLDAAGEVTHVIEAARDVSDLVRAREAQSSSEARFRALVEQAADAIFLLNDEGRILDANQRACVSLGYDRAELLTMNIADVDAELESHDHKQQYWDRLHPKTSVTFEGTHCRKDGSCFPVEVRLGLLELADSKLLMGLVRDITERRQAEEQRLAHTRFIEDLGRINEAILTRTEHEELLEHVCDTVLDIFQCDRACLIYPCDPDAPTWHMPVGRTRPEYPNAPGRGQESTMLPALADYLRALLASGAPVSEVLALGAGRDLVAAQGARSRLGIAIHPRVGKPWLLCLEQCSHPRVWTEYEQRLFQEIGRRIADAVNNVLFMQELQESERKYRGLVETQPVGVVIHRPDGEVVYANPTMGQILQYDPVKELVGKNAMSFVHPDSAQNVRSRLEAIIKTNQAQPAAEEWLVRKDGSHLEAEIRGAPIMYMGEPALQVVIMDITDRKLAEEKRRDLEAQLRRSQRLEAIGQLAGGVAHDFNNILTAIVGHYELSIDDLRREVGPMHYAVQALEEINVATQRAATLTRQLLTFSRRDVVQPQVLDLNQILAQLDGMLRRLVSKNIMLGTVTEPQLKTVRVDAGQIEQVVVNLVVNAVHAMPDGGRLTLETQNVLLDEDYLDAHAEARVGPHVLLTVSDTGRGMDAATLDRIFEPFFTTKTLDMGTGLGLSTVHGIVQQAGGYVVAYSELGRGTTFRVYLPAAEGAAPVPTTSVAEAPRAGGEETVLLCEDDPVVRGLTARVLEGAGYMVLVASGGREALKVAAEHEGTIDLLVTDVIITDMNGRQLSSALQEQRPGLPTLFISGYTSNVIAHHGVLDDGVEFLPKPFNRRQLLGRVREVLDKGQVVGDPSRVA